MPKILVVDDDRAIVEMLVDLLSANGYDVSTCRDGRHVLDELATAQYDLVLLDVLIPKMNGFTLIEELRQNPATRDLPVIMMSGIYRSRNHRTEMTTRYDVIDYLDKPIKTDVLIDLIRRVAGPGQGHDLAAAGEPEVLDRPKPLAQASGEPTHSMVREEPADERLVDAAAREEKEQVEQAARREFATSAFLLQGSIRSRPVAGILGKLWQEKATGALLLRQDKVKKIVYLRDGHPQFVKSNLVSECLGQILLRERLISEQECADSIELMRKSGRRQGEILVEMRVITPKNLTFALELQLETKLFDCFVWGDGEYRFSPSVELPEGGVSSWEGPALVAEGIRRTFDETRLRSFMLPVLDVPLSPREPNVSFAELGLSGREEEVIASAALPATTRSLLENLPLDPPETLRLVYTLIALEMLVPAR